MVKASPLLIWYVFSKPFWFEGDLKSWFASFLKHWSILRYFENSIDYKYKLFKIDYNILSFYKFTFCISINPNFEQNKPIVNK